MSLNPLHRRRHPDGVVVQDTLKAPASTGSPLNTSATATPAAVPRPTETGAVIADKPVTHRSVTDQSVTDQSVTDRSVTDHDAGDRTGAQHRIEEVPPVDRASVVAREKEAFGGVKVGCAFFGWLTATGTAVLLTALVAAAGTAIGVASGAQSALAVQTTPTTGLRADIAILAVMVLGYYCGGYVAGRMARFNGIKQGVAVWMWGLLMGLVIAALAAIAGSRFDLLATLNGFPRLSSYEGQVGHAVVTVLLAIVAALVGATLGGLAGMRFHRRVDKAGLGR